MQLDGQYANERFTQECEQPEINPAVLDRPCDACGHALKHHSLKGCTADRTTWAGGIAKDGPCGCEAFEFDNDCEEVEG